MITFVLERVIFGLIIRFVCEVINGSVTKQPAALPPESRLEEGDNKQEHNEQNDILPKNKHDCHCLL
jgi:hypothetical protein